LDPLKRLTKRACWLLAVTGLVLATGCVSSRSKNVATTPGSPQRDGNIVAPSGEVFGPQETFGPPTPEVPYGPQPVQLAPIALVFGPGMARGYAYVGVLRALNEMKIPIASITGMQFGSLVAAIYAVDPNINHFEFSLMRFKEEDFLPKSGLMNLFEGSKQDTSRLAGPLRQVFGKVDISAAKIPLKIAIQEKTAALPTLIDKGAVVKTLRVSLADPQFFAPGTWDLSPAQAAIGQASAAYLCQEVKSRGGNPIVFVDAGTTPTQASAADYVIRIELPGITEGDFSKRTDIIFFGKKVTEDRGDDLRKLVGLGAHS
jgi:predicted acylesterase/phospholipase RssA